MRKEEMNQGQELEPDSCESVRQGWGFDCVKSLSHEVDRICFSSRGHQPVSLGS